ncbi:FecR domain-containing protein [Alistipes sp. OttesenSCG-928-B03]|nr:FecR domain-containing protein [Alistipes sp. OttesenSCG-928-B03]
MKNWKEDVRRAARLLELLRDDATGAEKKEEIRAWFWGNVSNKAKEGAMEDYFDKLTPNPSPDAYEHKKYAKQAALLHIDDTQAKLPLKRKTTHLRRIAMKAAVAAVIFLGISGVAYLWVNEARNAAEQHTVAEVTAADGEIKHCELPDGSHIKISSGSIRHATTFDNERRVELKGEAHFNVARDTTKTFTVHTDHLKIAVLGTEFRVHSTADSESSTVQLYRGSVEVGVGEEALVMLPGQHLSYNHLTGETTISKIAIKNLEYDNMPNLLFDGSTLAEVFEVLGREYGISIIFADNVDIHKEGLHADLTQAKSIDGVLNILASMTQLFTYEITDTEVLIQSTNK